MFEAAIQVPLELSYVVQPVCVCVYVCVCVRQYDTDCKYYHRIYKVYYITHFFLWYTVGIQLLSKSFSVLTFAEAHV